LRVCIFFSCPAPVARFANERLAPKVKEMDETEKLDKGILKEMFDQGVRILGYSCCFRMYCHPGTLSFSVIDSRIFVLFLLSLSFLWDFTRLWALRLAPIMVALAARSWLLF
jgi:hypothetical protein